MPNSAASSKYDVVVIGAGISGLISAAYLAKAGAHVLVCEQASQVGGLFNSFKYRGYQFDGGIKGVVNSAVMKPMLAQLGLLDRIPFRPSPISMITNNQLHTFKGFDDIQSYFDVLATIFPVEKDGLAHVLADTRTVFGLLDGMLGFPVPFFDRPGSDNYPGSDNEIRKVWMKENAAVMKYLPALRFSKKPMRTYLQGLLKDECLINLLSQLFPDGTSTFFGLGYFRLFLDYSYPQGGIQTLPDTLAQGAKEWGAEILLDTRVTRVLTSDGKASGVVLNNEQEINAGYVVAASSLKQAIFELTPQAALPKRFERQLRQAETSHSVFNVFIGLDMPVDQLNFKGSHHLFYNPDLQGISEQDRVSRADYFSVVPQEISIPCTHQADLAPAGKTGLNLSAMASWHFNGGWGQDEQEYERRKALYAQQMIESFAKFVPDIKEHIEFTLVSTPRSIFTRTSNTDGGIMGWSYHREKTMPRGGFLQMPSSVKTPIPNLYTTGQWAYSPGGSPTAVLTGKLTAEAILKDFTGA